MKPNGLSKICKATFRTGVRLVALMFGAFQIGVHTAGALDLTIITHGLQFDNSYPSWIDAMTDGIKARTADTNTATIYAEVGLNANSKLGVTHFYLEDGQWPGTNSTTEHIVMKLLWYTVAGLTDPVDTGMVADQIVPYLINPLSLGDGSIVPALAEAPIHLIGHSRGSSVVAAVTRRFAQHGIWVDHLTTLDPHPIGSDEAVAEYANVRFADNYFQIDSSGFTPISGMSVPGAIQINLTALFDGDPISDFGNFSDHIEVHDWYYGTIDEAASTVAGDPIPRSFWYSSFDTGFQFSLIADGQRLREMPELGSGSGLLTQGAARTSAAQPSGAPQYPSIELLNTNWSYEVYAGSEVPLLVRYQGAAIAPSAIITVGLSRTMNPYLPVDSIVASATNGAVGSAMWEAGTTWVPNAADDGKFIFANIAIAGATRRFFYLPRAFHVAPRPSLVVSGLSPETGITLEVRSIAGKPVHLQRSQDLREWTDLYLGPNDDGKKHITDAAATNEPVAFYRVLAE
jgi:hypothetical protein